MIAGAPIAPGRQGRSGDQAGKAFGVSGRSVDRAKYILDHGTTLEKESLEKGKEKLKPLEAKVRERVKNTPTLSQAEYHRSSARRAYQIHPGAPIYPSPHSNHVLKRSLILGHHDLSLRPRWPRHKCGRFQRNEAPSFLKLRSRGV